MGLVCSGWCVYYLSVGGSVGTYLDLGLVLMRRRRDTEWMDQNMRDFDKALGKSDVWFWLMCSTMPATPLLFMLIDYLKK